MFEMMMSLRVYLLAAFISPISAATYYWTAGGDGNSVYQEANWTENADGTGAVIPVINNNVAVNHDLIVNRGTPGGGGGAGANLALGSGSLTVNGGTFRMNVGGNAGITSADLIVNGGEVISQYLTNGVVTLNGGDLRLHGSGNFLSSTTINFTAGSDSLLYFVALNPSTVVATHLSKMTVAGVPAEASGAGQNVIVGTDAMGTFVMLGTGSSATLDTDQDGLTNDEEAALNTNPNARDSDGDGTPDGLEVERGLNPNDRSDGLTRPNIIFFFVDDLGYGDLGCFWQDSKQGSQKFDTPGIDEMAATGAKMTHHYISAPVCAPSRASLLQGRHQGHSDVRDSQFDRALPNNHSMADTLRRAGYRTIHVGKNGLAGGEGSTNLMGSGSQNLGAHPMDRGFDEFFGYLFHGDGHEHYPRNGTTDKTAHIYNGFQQVKNASTDLYTTDAWTAYAKKSIVDEVNDADGQPFFLYLAYETPHFKMQRPAVAYPAGGGLNGGVQWTTATDGAGNIRFANTATGTGTIDGFNHPDNNTSWPVSNQQHVGMIRRIDNSVADIIQLLKDLNIDDNTICVFSSDNGPHNEGNNPRYFESFANLEGIKRDMWEGGIRVPTVVRWPGNIAGTTDDEGNIHEIAYPSSIWDWMPTFAELAEVPAPAWCDGVSLVPTLKGQGTQRDKGYLYFEFNTNGSTPNWSDFPNHRGDPKGQMQCLRMGDYIGVRTSISSAADNFQIYDAVLDPGQELNLAAALPDLQSEMKNLALQARRPGPVSRPYDGTNLPAIPTSSGPGLKVASYEGVWSYVPEFRDLTAVATGVSTGLDLSQRSRDEHVGLLFSGFVSVPTAGSYTFFLQSDAGSNLFIHDAHVIDDDYLFNGTERSGTVPLAAGLHPIRVYYRHATGSDYTLNLSWSGPGITKEPVPNSALVKSAPVPPEPTATDDVGQSDGGAVDIDVLSNDLDDGAPMALSISSVAAPNFGIAAVVGNQIRYTPDIGFYGTETFLYTITDGQFSASASITVTVNYQAADLWIPLNEASGTELHEAGGALLGAMTGFANSETARIPGIHGNALEFDGSDDVVSLSGIPASLLPDGDSPRTMMAWVKTNPALENQTIFGYGANANGQRFSFRTNGSAGSPASQPLRLEVQGGFIVGSTNLNDGSWHHVALVCDDFNSDGTMNVNETKLYVDGQLETIANSGSRAINTAAGSTAVLGGSNHSANYSFAGSIDEFRFYPVALTQAQVLEIYEAPNEAANAWHRANFGPATIDWTADLDGDGASRLAEYAFGINPNVAEFFQLLVTEFDPETGVLSAQYRRRSIAEPGVFYAVEASNDLIDWDTLTVTQTGTTPVDGDDALEWATISADVSAAVEPVQFLRVRVNLE